MAGELEVRRSRGRKRLRGRFPYKKRATISAGGNGRRPVKEEFAPGAFSFAVNDPERDIHLLVGHDFGKPLASKKTGSMVIQDLADALVFDADLAESILETSYFRDFWAGYESGLVVGISPGFRIPPPEAVPDAEEMIEEDPKQGNALIRVIKAAVLFEISLVTRPAYEETEVEARQDPRLIRPAALRWR